MKFNKTEVINQAQVLAKDFDADKANEFANKHVDKKWYSNFILLYQMITDSDFSLDTSVYLTIAGALAYVIMPIDVIPDFIPGVGFIDDIFIIGVVMKNLSDEVERYQDYLQEV